MVGLLLSRKKAPQRAAMITSCDVCVYFAYFTARNRQTGRRRSHLMSAGDQCRWFRTSCAADLWRRCCFSRRCAATGKLLWFDVGFGGGQTVATSATVGYRAGAGPMSACVLVTMKSLNGRRIARRLRRRRRLANSMRRDVIRNCRPPYH